MSRVRRSLILALSVAMLLLLATGAGAKHDGDLDLDAGEVDAEALSLDAVDEPVDEALPAQADDPTALDRIGDLLGSAADVVAGAAGAVADAVAGAAMALGQGLWTAVTAVGSALWVATKATGSAIAWTGSALWTGVVAVAEGMVWLGAALGHGTTWLATGVATAALWLGRSTVAVVTGGAELIAVGAALTWNGLVSGVTGLVSLWPQDPRHQAAVAGAAGASAAAAGAGAWYAKGRGLWKVLPFLAPLYARIDREDLLDHPMRQALYDTIQENPGIHVSELGRTVDVSWGTLLHHLGKLERGRLIVSEEASGKRCFFLPGQVSADQKEILPALENETARALAQYFADHPGATQGQAGKALGLSAALVSWHVKRLEKAGVLTRTRAGRTKKVGVTESAMVAMSALA